MMTKRQRLTKKEVNAIPLNHRQEHLVSYFSSDSDPEYDIVRDFALETISKTPNFPLMIRYFKQANNQLKKLLVLGLKYHPTNLLFLTNLAEFHIYSPMQQELIDAYINACKIEDDPKHFKSIVANFIQEGVESKFNALAILKELFMTTDSYKAEFIKLKLRQRDGNVYSLFC
ncbi:hypothetical protein [Candidatus Tisiphia endosymbiont of Nedyus quadrimaculatus]|uniref:hypothetical protein n=1 Tax=Candidatus Tisiphia endosymbiont of Nedyus quadrimaculatus TaxID=3139332 RepID=UPI00345EF6C0